MVAPSQLRTKKGVLGSSRYFVLLSALAVATVAIYVSLDDLPAPRQASMNEKQLAEAIRKQSTVAKEDIDSPKKMLTAKEIETGEW